MTAPPDPPPATGALALSTRALTLRFGACTALDGVSLHLAASRVHALLGDNGAGKSCLARCIAGFARAGAGHILIDGHPCDLGNPAAARAQGIAMVHQHSSLEPAHSVADNLLPPGGHSRGKRAELSAFLATTPFAFDLDTTVAALSAADRQALELLKALYWRPRLLVLDEPTSLMTPAQADVLLSHVQALAQRGACTVLMVTHRLREVMAWADDVSVLRQGRQVYSAAVARNSHARLLRAMLDDRHDRVLPFALAGTRADRAPALTFAA